MTALKNGKAVVGLLATWVAICAPHCMAAESQKEREPENLKVELLKVPNLPCGPGGTAELKGKVTGLTSYKDYQIVIYAKCDGIYYVQPTIASPLTDIDDEGTFTTDVHGGQEYVALVVKDGYKPAAQIEQLPREGGSIVAKSKPKRSEKSSEKK